MIYKVFSAYDVKACAYMQPAFYSNAQLAMRGFSDGCKDTKSPFFVHPEDYQLFEVGSWDDVAGLFTGVTPPKFICAASDFVERSIPVSVSNLPEEVLNGGSR